MLLGDGIHDLYCPISESYPGYLISKFPFYHCDPDYMCVCVCVCVCAHFYFHCPLDDSKCYMKLPVMNDN